MSMELIEKLEQLVSILVLESQRLKGENRRLADQVQSLSDEISELRYREADLGKDISFLASLKSENQKMQFQKDQVKGRVRGILKKLEKIDFF